MLEGDAPVTLYRDIGASLRDVPLVTALRQKLIAARDEEIANLMFTSKSFFVVDAPSGSGKTQLPFALADSTLRVFHLVMLSRFDVDVQSIYRYLASPSLAFRNALMYDLTNTFSDELPTYAVVICCAKPLLCVKFLFKVLGQDIRFNECTVERLTSAVRAIRSGPNRVSLPVTFLDEAWKVWLDPIQVCSH